MNGEEVFAEVAHDLRGALGSLRLVLSSLIDEDDAERRRAMLRLGDEETLRIAAGLPALPALALAAATNASDVDRIDLPAAITDAKVVAARYGGTVTVGHIPPVEIVGRPAVVALALPALFVLACGIDGETGVTAEVVADGLAIVCTAGPLWPQARHLVTRLADALGAAAVIAGTSVRLTLSVAT